MPAAELDTVVIGAGAAGLAAALELKNAGQQVLCLEARDRIGGRILTVHDPLSPVPIELGAEFIHGRSPDLWNLAASAGGAAYDTGGRMIHVEAANAGDDVYQEMDRLFEDVKRSASEDRDESFASFLDRSSYSEGARQDAIGYVEGFNAARKETISLASLAEDFRGADAIGGDRSYRTLSYDRLVRHLAESIELRLNTIVERVDWQRDCATVHTRAALDGSRESFQAHAVVVTVPLGVLQANTDAEGAICFDPEPREALAAARALCSGDAIRLILRFDRAFWHDNPDLADAGFLFSSEPVFSTWWTTLPVHSPVITGWSAGPKADQLLGLGKQELVERALASLARITHVQPSRLEAAYFHAWHADPFSRGAYSYVPVGALAARRRLAEPVEHTLFFAGEATDLEGHGGTVHGALASGKRAARQVLRR